MMEVDVASARGQVAPKQNANGAEKARGRKRRPRRTRRAARGEREERPSEPAWRRVKRPENLKAGVRKSSRIASAEATQKIYYCLTAFWSVMQ